MNTFSIAYAIVTPESAECGEAEEIGMLDTGLRLRDAITLLFQTRTSACDGVSAIECSEGPDSGLCDYLLSATVYNGMEFETGATENRSLHPENVITAASWQRIVRLIKGE